MIDICRFCLSASVELLHDLHQNSELMGKISCFQIEIVKDDSLPSQICIICKDTIEKINSFLKMVVDNQNSLYLQLKSGKDCLVNFYNLTKYVKHESKDPIIEELKPLKDFKLPLNDIKNDIDFDHGNTSTSSDENVFSVLNLPNLQNINETDSKCKKAEKSHTSTISKDDKSLNISEYKCLTCFKVFNNHLSLYTHYKSAHKPDLPTREKIIYTEVEERGSRRYKCNKCMKLFKCKKTVQGHRHQERRPYTCNLCGRTYREIRDIILHLRAHNGTRLYCSHRCGYSTVYKSGLKTHEKQHKDEYKYKCDECSKGFEVRTWFEDHLNEHTGAKPYVCDLCTANYHCKRYLARHRTTAHPATVSGDKTRYTCMQCLLPCDTKIALDTHLSAAHGIKQCFLCDQCGKSFKRRTNLQSHKKCHLGIKNYTCRQCNKLFSSSNSLKRHELTHIGFKQHECAECKKRYTHKAALLKHQLRYHYVPVKCPE